LECQPKSGGTIKTQGQLDGKFMAGWTDMCLQRLDFSDALIFRRFEFSMTGDTGPFISATVAR
jgi:hypothetical protein